MKRNFSNQGIPRVESVPVDPKTLPEPVSPQDFLRRGMVFYARRQYEAAIRDLKKTVALDPQQEDGFYALGMVYKASQENNAAIDAFQKVIQILSAKPAESQARREMLRRLALGHINEINSGDWNLEKEIWVHVG